MHIISPYLGPFLSEFVMLKLNNKKRYSERQKAIAVNLLLSCGKIGYTFLRQMLPLPCLTTIRTAIGNIQCQPGIHTSNLQIIKIKHNLIEPNDRLCFILLDEMSLKKNISFDQKNGSYIGYEDDGYERSIKPATLSLCIMAVGIFKKWKVPFGYILANNSAPYSKIIEMIKRGISALENEQFTVLGITTDQGPNLERAFRQMGCTYDNPEIIVGNNTYHVYKDPPHLLKNTRNYLYRQPVYVPEFSSPAEWSHLVALQHQDTSGSYKFVPKLSQKHLFNLKFQNKMKVKLASQVLSNSCASAFKYFVRTKKMPEKVLATGEFCEKFNDLFDIMNSTNFKSPVELRRSLKKSSFGYNVLKDYPRFLEEMKTLNPKRPQVKFLDGWIQNINVLFKLVSQMESYGLPHLSTRYLCQDPLENFFGRIRLKQKFPDAKQFMTYYANLSSSTLLRAPKSVNCELDDDDDDNNEKAVDMSTNLLKQVIYNPSCIFNVLLILEIET